MSAVREHNRVTLEGRQCGERLSRMTDSEVGKLIAEGEWTEDERCVSCAFRHGTVPNGCPQTQLDVLKCVMEHEPFYCHMTDPVGTEVCSGWFAAMQAVNKKPPVKLPYEFSPPDPK